MTDEHKHWNCPPVRPPRRNELPGDPSDVETYVKHNDRYYDEHGEKDRSVPVMQYEHSEMDEEFAISDEFVDEHEDPVGLVRWNDQMEHFEGISADLIEYAGLHECSGTLIDDDLFLTAGHCLVVEGGPPPAYVARQMHVTFDYQENPEGKLRETQSYDVVELVEQVFQHAGLDYAILRLEGDHDAECETDDVPGANGRKAARLAWGDAKKGDTLCLIGHPNGLPKRVVVGNATHLHDVRIGYDNINTAPGSSGAGILSDTGKLVGVHSESGIGINKGHNHGTRISALLSASPTLRRLVEGPYRYESHGAFFNSRRSTEAPEEESQSVTQQKGK